MSMATVPTPREPAFLSILLSPLRAVERARGWRRITLLTLYGMMALMAWGLLWRQSQLVGLPDVGEPLDMAAKVPDDRNAFVQYRQAADQFRDMNDAEGKSFEKANLSWSAADATMRRYVAEHGEAIALLREGSERPEAWLEVPARPTRLLETSEKLEIARRLSWIGDAALFEAGRLRASGDPAGAWALLKAVVRASRHIERVVPTIQGRSHGIILVQFARGPVVEWADDPAVGIDLLRRAIGDLAAAEALTPPVSLTYRAEYLGAVDALANPQPLIAGRARRRAEAGAYGLHTLAPDLEAFLRREPERSRRVLRLLVANDLAWCDRPSTERPAIAVPRLQIYEHDPAAPPASRALSPGELARWADSSMIVPAPPWRMGEIEKWEQVDRWSMGRLKEAVAVPLFTREMGRPPASPGEALRRYFPNPGDTPDPDEAEPVPSPK
jgi:hypothetical protein